MMSGFTHPVEEILSDVIQSVLDSTKKDKPSAADHSHFRTGITDGATESRAGIALPGVRNSVTVDAPPSSAPLVVPTDSKHSPEPVQETAQPAVVDIVDLENSVSPPYLKSNSNVMTTITIVDDDDEITGNPPKTKAQPITTARSPHKQPVIENLDVDDDDDEIQIVSTAIIQPPLPTVTIDVDDDEVSPVSVNGNANRLVVQSSNGPSSHATTTHSDPQMRRIIAQQGPTAQSSLDVIECTPVPYSNIKQPKPVRSERRSTSCVICNVRVRDRQPISRCKHVLCDNCLLQAVVQSKKKSEETGLDESSLEQSEITAADGNTKSTTCPSYPESTILQNLPVCPVARCGAPLTHAEVYTALVPSLADEKFAPALHNFAEWMKNPNNLSNPVFGPGHIQFPSFEPDSGRTGVNEDPMNDSEPQESLVEDDLLVAYSPLWAWDEEYTSPSSSVKGGWMCLVCGEYESAKQTSETAATAKAVATKAASSHAGQSIDEDMISPRSSMSHDEGDSALPDPPLHTHCAYARAIGIVETMKGLAEARDGNFGKKTKRRSQRKTSTPTPTQMMTRTRKRYRSAAYIQNSKRRKTSEAELNSGFAKGTGYAGRSAGEWKGTSVKLLAEKAKIDQAVTHWLLRVRCFLIMSKDAALSSWPGFMRGLLRKRCIVSHLCSILINESIMDIQERYPVYVAALRVVHAICDSPSLRVLATEPPDASKGTESNALNAAENGQANGSASAEDSASKKEATDNDTDLKMNGTEASSSGVSSKTIAELVESISKQAALLSSGAGPDALPKSTEVLIKQIRRCIRLINRYKLLAVVRNRNGIPEKPVDIDAEDDGDAGQNGHKSKEEIGIISGNGSDDGVKMEDGTSKRNGGARPDDFESDKRVYMEEMKKFQFETVPGLAKTNCFYDEAMKLQATSVPTGKRQRRIAGEVASLFSSLPLSWSSTILLRADEDRYDFLRAVIFGPEDTPYNSGAFVFDIWLPLEYPTVPPKFRLLTTGAGRVRFNPNLYNSGKVCLSLLGTWSGPSWTAASTILQVLVSIQSLILVPDPYFNEPGFERHMGTVNGRSQSSKYNERVRKDCAFYAIQYNIRNVTPDIQKGILTHFRLKRRYIHKVLCDWFPLAWSELEQIDAKEKNPQASTNDSEAAANGAELNKSKKEPDSIQEDLSNNVLPPPYVKKGVNVTADPEGSAGPGGVVMPEMAFAHPSANFGIGLAFGPPSLPPGVRSPSMPQTAAVSSSASKTMSSLQALKDAKDFKDLIHEAAAGFPTATALQSGQSSHSAPQANGSAQQKGDDNKKLTQLPSMAMLTQSLTPGSHPSSGLIPPIAGMHEPIPSAATSPSGAAGAPANGSTGGSNKTLQTVSSAASLNTYFMKMAQILDEEMMDPYSPMSGPGGSSSSVGASHILNAAQHHQMFSFFKPGRNFRSFSMSAANLKTILNDLDKL